MASINFNADVKIKVVFPNLTKGISSSSRAQVTDTGAVKFEPRPQVDATRVAGLQGEFTEEIPQNERVEQLGQDLDTLIDEARKILKAFKKRAKRIQLEYNPDAPVNEALVEAEENVFGTRSGTITMDMYDQMLDLEERINKWLTHQSILNGGVIDGVA